MTGKAEALTITTILGIISGADGGGISIVLAFSSIFAGIASFILNETEKSFGSFIGEIVVSFFAGYFLGRAGAEIMNLGENATIAMVSLIAFMGRQILLSIRKRLPDIITDKIADLFSKK